MPPIDAAKRSFRAQAAEFSNRIVDNDQRENHQPPVLCGSAHGRGRYSEGLFPQRSKVKLMLVGNAGMGQLSKRSAAI